MNKKKEKKDDGNIPIDILIEILEADMDILNVVEKKWYATIDYVSKQNKKHIFKSRVFPSTNIRCRLVGEGDSREMTNYTYDRQIDIGRQQQLIYYRQSDVGTLSNSVRIETISETFGYPFRRHVSYKMSIRGKDRLQYKANCQEIHLYDIDDERKQPLDNHFISRVYSKLLEFHGVNSSMQRRDIMRKDKSISGEEILEILKYLYTCIKSYNPFFYHSNGICKMNVEHLKHTIRMVEMNGLLKRDYDFTTLHRKKNVDRTQIKQKDVERWRKERQKLLDEGNLWEDIEEEIVYNVE